MHSLIRLVKFFNFVLFWEYCPNSVLFVCYLLLLLFVVVVVVVVFIIVFISIIIVVVIFIFIFIVVVVVVCCRCCCCCYCHCLPFWKCPPFLLPSPLLRPCWSARITSFAVSLAQMIFGEKGAL